MAFDPDFDLTKDFNEMVSGTKKKKKAKEKEPEEEKEDEF